VTAPATEPHSGGLRAAVAPLGLAAAVGAATLALRFRDPHEQGSWGGCPFLLLTGHACPGCGGLRAVNDLTHFDLLAAASSNLYFVASIPLLVFGWLVWVRRSWSGQPVNGPSTPLVVTLLVLLIAFWIVRNTPWGAWLAP
jgi:hypothetical protein